MAPHPDRKTLNAAASHQVEQTVPTVKHWFQSGFHLFLRRYLARHFHAVAVERSSLPNPDLWTGHDASPESVLVYGNHPSWWDPLVAHYLNVRLMGGRQFYAPIDARALESYQAFGKLGFFGVELERQKGAANFLKLSHAILNSPDSALWLTPEGRFADARDHDAELMPGLAHLCERRESGWVLSLALEYVFWDERLPVCLARFSSPVRLSDHPQRTKAQWNDALTGELRENQTQLAKLVTKRDASPFDNLLEGKKGAGWVYDSFRRVKAWATGQDFDPQHGKQFR